MDILKDKRLDERDEAKSMALKETELLNKMLGCLLAGSDAREGLKGDIIN